MSLAIKAIRQSQNGLLPLFQVILTVTDLPKGLSKTQIRKHNENYSFQLLLSVVCPVTLEDGKVFIIIHRCLK